MAKASANIRMYRLNELGDCFLLTFTAGTATSRMLIDCGSFRNSGASIARLQDVTAQIIKDLGGQPLDVVVATHQHNDHVSGFVHCEKTFKDKKMGVRHVWLSWLDNPSDAKARKIGEDHQNLTLHLAGARDSLRAAIKGKPGARQTAARSMEVLDDILGFYGAHAKGAAPALPANAIKILKALGEEKPLYLKPGRTIDMPGLPPDTVRVHVLGPPRRDDLLYRKDPRKGESYDHALASHVMMATKFLSATRKRRRGSSNEDTDYPFNQEYKRQSVKGSSRELKAIKKRYRQKADAWRTIDDDWMRQAEALALYLDTFTNNSSLALAIELVEIDKVLLFAADAQTGNWISWKDVKWERPGVTTDSLLARTVLYKVGHHASHNATLVETFEKLTHPELAALIPVHKKDPNITKVGGWKMPARNLFKKLKERTSNRVLQMDGVNPPECDPAKAPAKASWEKIKVKPKVSGLAIELEIGGG